MKMTAYQISRIALHVGDTHRKFPEPEPHEQGIKDAPSGEIEMEPWECHLKALIDADPDLPSYDDLSNSSAIGFVEYLLIYFEEED